MVFATPPDGFHPIPWLPSRPMCTLPCPWFQSRPIVYIPSHVCHHLLCFSAISSHGFHPVPSFPFRLILVDHLFACALTFLPHVFSSSLPMVYIPSRIYHPIFTIPYLFTTSSRVFYYCPSKVGAGGSGTTGNLWRGQDMLTSLASLQGMVDSLSGFAGMSCASVVCWWC